MSSSNQNFATGAQARIERSTCGRCTKPVISAMHAERVTIAIATPGTAIYIVKRIIDGRTITHQHVRPQEFFDGRNLDQYAALVAHDCKPEPTDLFEFNRDDNTSTGYTQTIATCEHCKQPIVWSTERPRPGQEPKRIPMDIRQRILIVKAGSPSPSYQTPREFFDALDAGRGLNLYAACAAHHAFCPPYQAAQAAARSRQ